MLLREVVFSADKDVKETIKTIRWTTKRSGNSLTLTFEKDNIALIYPFPTVDYVSLDSFLRRTSRTRINCFKVPAKECVM